MRRGIAIRPVCATGYDRFDRARLSEAGVLLANDGVNMKAVATTPALAGLMRQIPLLRTINETIIGAE